MPHISPTGFDVESYTITDSRKFVVNSLLDLNAGVPLPFTVTYPDPAPAGLNLTLVKVGSNESLDLTSLPDDAGNTGIGGRVITVHREPGTATTEFTVSVRDPSNGAIDEHWELRVSARDPQNWGYTLANRSANTVVRLVCDPRAELSTPSGTLLEKDDLKLRAADARGDDAFPTVLVNADAPLTLPAPVPTYRFAHQGAIAIPPLPSPVGTSQSFEPKDVDNNPRLWPGVYGDTAVQLTVDVVLPGIGGDAFLSRTGVTPVTLKARPQRVQLIMDRSGSMSEFNKWENAKTAVRIFINFFGQFRAGVSSDDRIGVTVFTDNTGLLFRGTNPAGPPDITDIIPLAAPDVVASAPLGPEVFGVPGGTTPLGDGLFFGLRKLQEAGFPPNVRFTCVLHTDGLQNSGTIRIGEVVNPNGAREWTQAKADPAIQAITSTTSRLELFALAHGPDADKALLQKLVGAQHFAGSDIIANFIDTFATMFKVSQEANKLDTRFTDVLGGTPPQGPLTEVFFNTNRAQRFGVAVLKEATATGPAAPIDSVEIARWNGSKFDPENITATQYEGHFYIGVNDATAFNGGSATWRIRRLSGGVAQPIELNHVFAFEDLRVKSVLSLDSKNYLTGDTMRLTVELREDGEPLRDATVRAVLDAPDESLSTLIAELDADDLARHEQRLSAGDDQPQGRAALAGAVLHKHGWDHLPHRDPDRGGLFDDHTDVLHDRDGDGIYTNRFSKVNADGVYNWTVFVSGEDSQGNPFSHRLDATALAAIGVDRRTTIVEKEPVTSATPQKTTVLDVTVTPRDKFKNLLGPGFDESVIWAITDGASFDHIVTNTPAPVHTDGTYTRRIIVKRGSRPTLRVSINGVVLPAISLT
ncbi:vWA domain-containing protein [Winogradskya humida]|uniref:VWFA domain-containing protein n=1 Tax=Winogradskya humida TaxID=113566 RepID=A0ABQ3ZYB0_9ACTN|nr:vWA domain-containing protein [Actinoplanes humidus]GIE23640.1 hypothetical protein Ahu01nite_067420 [Actinoplanes humidus]